MPPTISDALLVWDQKGRCQKAPRNFSLDRLHDDRGVDLLLYHAFASL